MVSMLERGGSEVVGVVRGSMGRGPPWAAAWSSAACWCCDMRPDPRLAGASCCREVSTGTAGGGAHLAGLGVGAAAGDLRHQEGVEQPEVLRHLLHAPHLPLLLRVGQLHHQAGGGSLYGNIHM